MIFSKTKKRLTRPDGTVELHQTTTRDFTGLIYALTMLLVPLVLGALAIWGIPVELLIAIAESLSSVIR